MPEARMDDAEVMRIAEGLAELKGTVSTFMTNWQTQDAHAAESRRELHKKMTDLQVTVGGLTRDLAEVVNDVSEMRPKLENLDGVYHQGRGAVWILRGLRIAGIALVGLIGWMFAHVFPLLTFKGRP